MIEDFRKRIKFKKTKNGQFFDILQLQHTVISNSEKLTHPTVHGEIIKSTGFFYITLNF